MHENEEEERIVFMVFNFVFLKYLNILFESLRQSIENLYQTCEVDENCLANREVALILNNPP